MLTIFTSLAPSVGYRKMSQLRALNSWKEFCDDIIIVGDPDKEQDIDWVADQVGARVVTGVDRGDKRPLVNHLFMLGQDSARYDLCAYVNGDIILYKEFMDSISLIEKTIQSHFLCVGQRTDLPVGEPISGDWLDRVRKQAVTDGKLHPPGGIDYFAFRTGFYVYDDIPPFELACFAWDNWLCWYPHKRKVPSVDLTDMVLAVHQDHRSLVRRDSVAANRNRELMGDKFYHVGTCTHKLTKEGLWTR